MTPALLATEVVKCFDSVRALDRISVVAHAGEVTALLGPNGAGKSTLFRCAVGLAVPDSGQLLIAGHQAGSAAARRKVGYLAEAPDLYPGLSVAEHVTFIGLAHRVPDAARRAEVLLSQFGLADKRDVLPAALSQGMRRKLSIVMTLVQGAEVLLFDEPFNGLDPVAAAELRGVLRDLAAAGRAVIVSMHGLADVQRLADRMIVLYAGQMLASGSLDELRTARGATADAELEDLYLDLVGSARD